MKNWRLEDHSGLLLILEGGLLIGATSCMKTFGKEVE